LVIGPQENTDISLVSLAKKEGIETIPYEKIYEIIQDESELDRLGLHDIDLIISYLFWKKIKSPLLQLPKIGCINFHPAPLPDFRGVNGYSFAIYENLSEWGVSAHFVDEDFDTGDIIKVNKFSINSLKETSFSLERKSQEEMLNLFKEIIDMLNVGKSLTRIPQNNGKYRSKEEFEELRKIKETDSLDQIERKIRAFWYPPYEGAVIKIKNKEFTIINKHILEEISKLKEIHQ
jgi:methionyl-tRNA formyltransferase